MLWPNQSHWLAAFFTLHSLLSFLAARGKAFGHFNGLSLANSLFCNVCNCMYVRIYLCQSNSISEIHTVLFWVWGEIYPGYLLAVIVCKVAIFIYIFNHIFNHIFINIFMYNI